MMKFQNLKTGKQQGFTLIELMIVITIIGILASIAVPFYRDYTIRTRVSECSSVFSPIKTAIGINYSNKATLPGNLTALPQVDHTPASYEGDYVEQMDLSGGGTGPNTPTDVTCTLKNLDELGDASRGTVIYTGSTNGANIGWDISSGSSVPTKYWPDA